MPAHLLCNRGKHRSFCSHYSFSSSDTSTDLLPMFFAFQFFTKHFCWAQQKQNELYCLRTLANLMIRFYYCLGNCYFYVYYYLRMLTCCSELKVNFDKIKKNCCCNLTKLTPLSDHLCHDYYNTLSGDFCIIIFAKIQTNCSIHYYCSPYSQGFHLVFI